MDIREIRKNIIAAGSGIDSTKVIPANEGGNGTIPSGQFASVIVSHDDDHAYPSYERRETMQTQGVSRNASVSVNIFRTERGVTPYDRALRLADWLSSDLGVLAAQRLGVVISPGVIAEMSAVIGGKYEPQVQMSLSVGYERVSEQDVGAIEHVPFQTYGRDALTIEQG